VKFNGGTALPGDTAAIAASLLQRREDELQLRGDRSAALARLSELVGRPVSEKEAPAVGDYSAAVASTAKAMDTLRARPEYQQFAASRDRLAKQDAAAAARDKPKISAYGRAGYAKPGLNVLANTFQTYWYGGVQVHWTPWSWGNTERDHEVAQLQEQIVTTNEQAFRRGLDRSVQASLASMSRLDSTLVLDDRVVALREKIDAETRVRLREGAVTASDYVDKSTDLLTARLVRVQHRVELAQARATFLATLGVEVP
jgi:outer membrane protein TolC